MAFSIALAMAMAAAQMQNVTVPAQPVRQPGSPPHVAAGPHEDSPEEIAKDSARDLKDSRFYNKPGATRAQYDADWQECRLIARGSKTPSGSYSYVYNPAVISPIAAGVGAGIGAAIAQAIIQGQLRRANRRSCLLIRGWRLVEVDDAEQKRVAALPDAEREHYFNAILGATELKGKKVTSWHNDFAAPRLAPESEQ
ncbi:MAG: hypothetical protein JWO81_468 [Alphaproteobacteria bacterium]|nr:hypothetical protein [Alphaproteobacteria bacterium]